MYNVHCIVCVCKLQYYTVLTVLYCTLMYCMHYAALYSTVYSSCWLAAECFQSFHVYCTAMVQHTVCIRTVIGQLCCTVYTSVESTEFSGWTVPGKRRRAYAICNQVCMDIMMYVCIRWFLVQVDDLQSFSYKPIERTFMFQLRTIYYITNIT